MTSLDGNRDGQLSASEFTSFLTKLASEGLGANSSTHAAEHEGTTPNEGPAPLLAGFDIAKLANPSHTTVKYLFGRVAQRYSLASVHDKASAESLLLQMRPDLEAAGITVLDVSRDKIQIRDDRGADRLVRRHSWRNRWRPGPFNGMICRRVTTGPMRSARFSLRLPGYPLMAERCW